MQTITYDEVVAAARRAYDDGTLLALLKERGDYSAGCFYRTPEGRCAVGAALSDETLRRLDHGEDRGGHPLMGATVDTLQGEGIVDCGRDLCRIAKLQQVHDQWLKYGKGKEEFLSLIGVEP